MSTSFLIDTQSMTTLSSVLDSLVSLRRGRWGVLKPTYLSARENSVFHTFSWPDRDQSLDTECVRGWAGRLERSRCSEREALFGDCVGDFQRAQPLSLRMLDNLLFFL